MLLLKVFIRSMSLLETDFNKKALSTLLVFTCILLPDEIEIHQS